MMEFQKTIAQSIEFSGFGLHTGVLVNVVVKPGEPNTGFVFVRTDLDSQPCIPADASLVSSTERSTTLEKNGTEIHTCEHILAAMVGMDLDNAIIELDASELPILDGSAKPFADAIKKAGIVEQDAEREYFEISEVISISDPDTGSDITIIPSENYEIAAMVDFGTKILGTQNAILKNTSDFYDEISSARTFSFLHELEKLLDAGLIKGGDFSNAIVYVDKDLTQETKKKLQDTFEKDEVFISSDGILNDIQLRFPNEAARHKLLDVVGDLALVGVRLKGKVIANKPGHRINTQFAKKIQKVFLESKKQKAPVYSPHQEPVFDINGIMKLLPHRPPFLLIDKITELSDSHVVGVKSITMNEPYFVGHFPSEPVMPGVLQIEALAQTGGILVLANVPDPENYSTYFVKIDQAKFKKKVVPGDTVLFKVELLQPIRRGIVHMKGYGYVGDTLVVEAELMAQVAKTK